MRCSRHLPLLVLLVFGPQVSRADPVVVPSEIGQVSLVEVSENIFVLHGMHAMPDGTNRGLISNSGIILTDDGVVVIDSGGSYAIGRILLEEIGKITSAPVTAVFNSHVHGDHWLGNSAIREKYPGAKFYAHRKAIDRLHNGDAESWRSIIAGMIGEPGNWPADVVADVALDGGEKIEIGNLVLTMHHTGHAHTDSDLIIESPGHRLVFTGDVVEHGRIVSSDVPRDFDARGQIAAIEYVLDLPVDTYVPGHGETGGREIPEAALRFLRIMYGWITR